SAAMSRGPWVGMWRPHRPRGLISAQFTSPGPKYTIPRTTGYLAHDRTKAKAPAYTFRGARPPTTDCSPGPHYFVPPSITRNGKYVAPAQPICGRHTTKTEVTPGPSEYHCSSPAALPWHKTGMSTSSYTGQLAC
ncbi:ODF3A protein, partial [Trogon melanurus]|nr:ODF3A protein [Trogon melanurus]